MAGEVNCPKGWGRIIFKDNHYCPVGDVLSCKDCKVGAVNPALESKWKRLKQGKTE